ncbi:MAG: hypothetical protein Q9227_008055 [Pyrenula ochraceoflavens]
MCQIVSYLCIWVCRDLRLVNRTFERIAAEKVFKQIRVTGPKNVPSEYNADGSYIDLNGLHNIVNNPRLCDLVRNLQLGQFETLGQGRDRYILQKLTNLRKLELIYAYDEESEVCMYERSDAMDLIKSFLQELPFTANLKQIPEISLLCWGFTWGGLPARDLVAPHGHRVLECLTILELIFDESEFSHIFRLPQESLAPMLECTGNLIVLSLTGDIRFRDGPVWHKLGLITPKRKFWPWLQDLTLANISATRVRLMKFLLAHKKTLRKLCLGDIRLCAAKNTVKKPRYGWIELLKNMGKNLQLQEFTLSGRLTQDFDDSTKWEARLDALQVTGALEPPSRRYPCVQSEESTRPFYSHAMCDDVQDNPWYPMIVDYVLQKRQEYPFYDKKVGLADPQSTDKKSLHVGWHDIADLGRLALSRLVCHLHRCGRNLQEAEEDAVTNFSEHEYSIEDEEDVEMIG